MTELFEGLPAFSDHAIDAIYALYPRKENRKSSIIRIREALARICGGEIDGEPRTPAEAIEFLRLQTERARIEMGSRTKSFIPHPSTWYHQRRYLKSAIPEEALPARLEDCIVILAEYPKMPAISEIKGNVDAFLPALCAIDKQLEKWEKKGIPAVNCARRMRAKTELYATAVKDWPAADLQYVPNPKKWFDEARYEHSEESWQRKSVNGYEAEREQMSKILRVQ